MTNKKIIYILRFGMIFFVIIASIIVLLRSLNIIKGNESKDKDLDGYIVNSKQSNDCDDSNGSINPGAKDIPDDGIDQNCDGKDESLKDILITKDFDNDKYEISIDCNDADPLIHPDAKEKFDLIDNNCDSTIDEDFQKVVLYENFNINSYDSNTIIESSRQISTDGNLEEAYLYVEAAVDSPESKLTPFDSIYIFLDSGIYGGQLLRSKSDMKDSGDNTKLLYDLKAIYLTDLPYDDNPVNYRELDYQKILNIPGTHRLGAFLGTQRKGSIKKMILGYKFGNITVIK
jgi:hypothetical protein